jgi:hypothetical protein
MKRVLSAALAAGAIVLFSSSGATTSDALLEQTKSHCIEVPRPGVEGFHPCFGFPR